MLQLFDVVPSELTRNVPSHKANVEFRRLRIRAVLADDDLPHLLAIVEEEDGRLA